ncbi:Phage anti-repressor protein [Citrobacter freundii]|uniref:phage antirepressor N-terminal domain-containing protein n=1 Tax=Citrobacter freundii TaxID=546 RepID=UPI000DF0F9A3|nr:phage antirepressor N-terminal domain-containing protein [Citrobacter freundii]STB14297.1 Phage anti-repressor protein [Citrobacter freundii]
MSIATAVSTINVPFHGDNLYLVSSNGEPYVPMKPIVEGMGLTWSSQFVKIKQRFAKGVAEIEIPSNGGVQSMTCLAFRKFAGWLHTINVGKVRPELREKVARYQEECDDVLYQYWTKGVAVNPRHKTTVNERTPLRDAVNLLVGKKGLRYDDAYNMVHQRFNVDSIDELGLEQIPLAVEYIHRIALEGEFLGKQLELPVSDIDISLPIQWWIDNNPVVRSGNLSFGKSKCAPSLDVTMDMLCGDNSTSSAIRLINLLEEAGFDVSAPKAEIVAMRKHLANVEYGMKAISDACRRAGSKTISFRGMKAEYLLS